MSLQILPIYKRTAFKLLFKESIKSRHDCGLYCVPNVYIKPTTSQQKVLDILKIEDHFIAKNFIIIAYVFTVVDTFLLSFLDF